MLEELHAWVGDRLVGKVLRDARRDRMTFEYDDGWRKAEQSFPLSLSMPMLAPTHGHDRVSPFLWGLLPDNDGVLRQWGMRFQVSPGNVFRLLEHVGEDCAGAVQFVKPGRTDAWFAANAVDHVQWLTDQEVADRLQLLLKDHSATRVGNDRGHFSLAGAQPKTAFHFDPVQSRWGVPFGLTPTTHIFKPPTGDFDGYAENEHFCLRLARRVGLATAPSTIMTFGGVTTIVSERYDRYRVAQHVRRMHQEDMCQALARMPQNKYQNDGGPSPTEIMGLIRMHSSARDEDETRFVDALIFNWLISGTDAHAKNYAFLIAPGGQTRLAPLYDLASALPYPQQIYPRHATLAMKVGNHYKLREIGMREWKKAAKELRYDEDKLIQRIRKIATDLPAAALDVETELSKSGIQHSVCKRMTLAIRERAEECARAMA
ncbi:MAG: type II toxin-antitoxin system HipA family toxin [Verrucomicrobiaceae bacterium]|nr:type II toxin-antitoxin system HipA family toxin [Verrucomicrobiaceae bacterium]